MYMNDVTPKQQTMELIRQAHDVLIVSHKNPDGDSLGSMLALKLVLEKLGKKVAAAIPDEPSRVFNFLPQIDQLASSINYSKDFIIALDTSVNEVEKLGYKKNESNKTVEIVITPLTGSFTSSDVSFRKAGPEYDLIISLDTPNLERLDKLAQPADIFYEIPLINIDHHPSNERFGKVNWIELVATSTAEVLVSLIEALSKEKPLMDEAIATALLTGLIYDTSSFQNVNTTPKALTIAAQLVAAGANQQEIVKNLYKTKSLETLKLWGFVLSNVKEDKASKLLWSAVTKEDIEAIGADELALSGVIDELLKSATDVDFALLLSEREGYTHGSLRSIAKGFNVSQIAELFGGGGHEAAAAFRLEGDLKNNHDKILQKIRDFQAGKELPRNGAPQKPETARVKEENHEEIKKPQEQDKTAPIELAKEQDKPTESAAQMVQSMQATELNSLKTSDKPKITDDFPPQSIEEELSFAPLEGPINDEKPSTETKIANDSETELNPREKTIKQTKW